MDEEVAEKPEFSAEVAEWVEAFDEVVAGGKANGVELLVIDRGPGTRDAQRRIPKAQLEEETDEDIGLSVASGFITLLGGELRFEDTPGGGLTVVIELAQDAPSSLVAAPSD